VEGGEGRKEGSNQARKGRERDAGPGRATSTSRRDAAKSSWRQKRSLKDGATAARRGGARMLGRGIPATATFSTGKRTSDDLRRGVRDGTRVSTRGPGGCDHVTVVERHAVRRGPMIRSWGVRTWKPRRARGSRRDARGRRYAHARGRRESRRGWRRWTAASCEWPVVVRVAPLGWAKISDGHHKRRNCKADQKLMRDEGDLQHGGDPREPDGWTTSSSFKLQRTELNTAPP
jgi:hypothetical protein